MKANKHLVKAFGALHPHELIRIRSHTEAWGVLSPSGPWSKDGKG